MPVLLEARKGVISPELELQVVVSPATLALGTELGLYPEQQVLLTAGPSFKFLAMVHYPTNRNKTKQPLSLVSLMLGAESNALCMLRSPLSMALHTLSGLVVSSRCSWNMESLFKISWLTGKTLEPAI